MGFIQDLHQGPVDQITGQSVADASAEAAKIQADAAREGIQFQRESLGQIRGDLQPFRDAGGAALDPLTNLITDPQAQADFLTNNPILDAITERTTSSLLANRAARGKLGSGGTLEALQQQNLANALPFLQNQQGQLFNLATLGQNAAALTGTATQNTANSVSNLLGTAGASTAAGIVGGANAQAQGTQNLASLGIAALALSDMRMKEGIKRVGETDGGVNIYAFRYKGTGTVQFGVMAQEVEQTNPDAVVEIDGIKYVDYSKVS